MTKLEQAKCCTDCWHSPQKPCPDFVECLTKSPVCHESKECTDKVNANIAKYKYDVVEKPVVFIGMGTCGLGAGAAKTRKAVENFLKTKNIDADIVQVGCIGLCAFEPIVDVQLPGKTRLSFQQVTEDKVENIFNSVFEGELPTENIMAQHRNAKLTAYEGVRFLDEHPFFKNQTRWVLANCGVIMPTNIDQYIAHGGFAALAKAQIGRAHV
mgnify:FL=1